MPDALNEMIDQTDRQTDRQTDTCAELFIFSYVAKWGALAVALVIYKYSNVLPGGRDGHIKHCKTRTMRTLDVSGNIALFNFFSCLRTHGED